jgi:DNA invertase Pin-like site-specific DNA recombinase
VAAGNGEKASLVISCLEELRARNKKLLLVLYMRVSTREQRTNGNLNNRLRWLRRKVRGMGLLWEKRFKEAADGRSLQRAKRPAFVEAIEYARNLQAENHDALVVVVTNTRDRFVRGRHFNGWARNDRLDKRQLDKLGRIAAGVLLASVLCPDASFKKVKRHEQEVAAAAGRQVGRPKKRRKPKTKPGEKKARKEALLPLAQKLLGSNGMSIRGIAKRLGMAHSTLAAWPL